MTRQARILLVLVLTAASVPGCAKTKATTPATDPGAAHTRLSPVVAGVPRPTPAPTPAQKSSPLTSWTKYLHPGKITSLLTLPAIFKKKPGPPQAHPPQWAGVVRMVNSGEKFVLIESQNPGAAQPGTIYLATNNGSETASLRMTSLKESPFLIADIVSGSPSAGNKIYLPSTIVPASAPPSPSPRPAPLPSEKPPQSLR